MWRFSSNIKMISTFQTTMTVVGMSFYVYRLFWSETTPTWRVCSGQQTQQISQTFRLLLPSNKSNFPFINETLLTSSLQPPAHQLLLLSIPHFYTSDDAPMHESYKSYTYDRILSLKLEPCLLLEMCGNGLQHVHSLSLPTVPAAIPIMPHI